MWIKDENSQHSALDLSPGYDVSYDETENL